jgi:GT2 family glycosyltransferase
MSSVSCVIPVLVVHEGLVENLSALLAEIERRGKNDEIVVVDDSGEDCVRQALSPLFPAIRFVVNRENLGFARALTAGVEAASFEPVFLLNSDVRVRRNAIGPLLEHMQDEEVFAAAPKVLLEGDPHRIESLTAVELSEGRARWHQPALHGEPGGQRAPAGPIAFAVGGACLLRRSDFLAEGLDPLYEPFYLEDLDLCWRAWRLGRRVVYEPSAQVEHRHRATISRVARPEWVRAAIEKNALLFQWKFLDQPESLRAHVADLHARALSAWLAENREELIVLALALEQRKQAVQARKHLPPARRGFAEICRASKPPLDG